MTRDPARIDPILADLRRYWHAAPDLRLGQMVMGLLDLSGAPRYGEFHAEDDKVAAYLAAWAAANQPPPDHRDTLPPEIEAAIAAAAWTVAELDRRADVMAQPEIADLRTAITSALAAAREAGRRDVLEGAAGVEEAIADYTEAAIMARPHASGHVLTAAGDDLRAAIARAISDATAAHGTVGGLLATAPVGSIVEFVDCAFWYQARVHVDDSVEWYETRRRHATDARWMPWKRGIPPVRPSARLVPAAEADADPNQRGPLPKGG